MLIISHRGYWKTQDEQNKASSFERSLSLGFGIETDIRDFRGELVISHDIGDEASMSLEKFFELYKHYETDLSLALNIKSDGLQSKLKKMIEFYDIENYFCFDMSVPDGLLYLKQSMDVFTRQSEYEENPSFYSEAVGVWMDEFCEHWIDEKIIGQHIKNQKRVVIVSPELHKRDHMKEWAHYREMARLSLFKNHLILCTDFPELARSYFDG